MPTSNLTTTLSSLLSPTPTTLLLTLTTAILLPLLLHLLIFRAPSTPSLPTILLLGPSSSGKTSLLTHLERGAPSRTQTTLAPLTVSASLPISIKAASARYRSAHDPSASSQKKFLLADTPGHGKLRHYALDSLEKLAGLKGVVFVVDAADLGPGSAGLRDAAEYLHDVLLAAQKMAAEGGSRRKGGLRVLVAANKLDLFEALTPGMVGRALEGEIEGVRRSRGRGLLDAGRGVDDVGDPEREWLGEGGEGAFGFGQMEEFEVEVVVEGGVAGGEQGGDVGRWWEWIGDCL